MEVERRADWRTNLIAVLTLVLGVAVLQPLLEPPEQSPTGDGAVPHENAWRSQRVAGLRLSAPGHMERVSLPALGSAGTEQRGVQQHAFYRLDQGPVWVGLTRIRYADRVRVRLPEVIGATMEQVDRVPGVRERTFQSDSVRGGARPGGRGGDRRLSRQGRRVPGRQGGTPGFLRRSGDAANGGTGEPDGDARPAGGPARLPVRISQRSGRTPRGGVIRSRGAGCVLQRIKSALHW